SWIIDEDERGLTAPLFRTTTQDSGCRDLTPASRRVGRVIVRRAACQPKWLATLEGEENNARDHYPPVPRVQEPELFHYEEQEDDHSPSGVLKVLQHLPDA